MSEQEPDILRQRLRDVVFPAVLIVAGILAYANSLHGSFIHDDKPTIADPHVHRLWPLHQAMWANKDSVASGRPVVSLTLAVNYALGGMRVAGYHVVNIAVHLCCALALYGIVRRTLEGPLPGPRFGRSAGPLALAGALLWMLHPVQTQVVNYISHRTESIMGLFYLLTLYCAIRARGDRRVGWSIASVACCALGMASKEAMVTAPAMVVLYDWAFGDIDYRQVLRRRLGLYAGLAATWLVLAALMATGPRASVTGYGHEVGVIQYALNQCLVVTHYLKLVFWPHPLIIDYGEPTGVSFQAAAPGALLLAVILTATLLSLILRPPLGFPAAWFFIILAPTSSIVPILTEVGADRRMYLPLAGPVVLAVVGGYALLGAAAARAGWRAVSANRAATAAVALAAGALMWQTVRANADYRDPVVVWEKVVAAVPDNARAYNNLGNELRNQGRIDEAIARYRDALHRDSGHVMANINLGNVLRDSGRPDEAVPYYLHVLDIMPEGESLDEVSYNLAKALVLLGRIDDAIVQFRLVLANRPDLPEVHQQLGLALGRRGDVTEAISQFRAALALRPDDRDTNFHLAIALRMTGETAQAIEHFRRAVEIDPAFAAGHQNLGTMLQMQGDLEGAIRHYRLALRADPTSAGSYFNLGMALQQQGRLDEAAAQAATMDQLAASYAAADRPEIAAAIAEQAVTLARAAQAEALAAQIQSRLEGYRSR